jgi:(p)ppGpp synthase/HD superfamily hydrolase
MADLFGAVEFAAKAHRGQYRKGGVLPYIVHPLAVMEKLLRALPDKKILAAAGVLHDVLEDTLTTPAELEQHFGPLVLALVKSATATGSSWEDTRQRAIAHLGHPETTQDMLWLALADKLDNLEALAVDRKLVGREVLWERFKAGPELMAWYYSAVFGILRCRLGSPEAKPLLERFEQKLVEVFI